MKKTMKGRFSDNKYHVNPRRFINGHWKIIWTRLPKHCSLHLHRKKFIGNIRKEDIPVMTANAPYFKSEIIIQRSSIILD